MIPEVSQYYDGLDRAHDILRNRYETADLAATHDELTGVLNKAGLDRELRDIDASNEQVAVLFIDGDNIKTINDNLGHDAGDRAIIGTARTLDACLRGGDIVARVGGDEFIVLLRVKARGESPEISLADKVTAATARLKVCVDEFQQENIDLYNEGFDLSVGSAVRQAGESLDQTKHRADTAMYADKARSRHNLSPDQLHALAHITKLAAEAGLNLRHIVQIVS